MSKAIHNPSPFGGLSDAQVAKIVRDYRNPTMRADDVLRVNKIGSERLRAILAAKGVAMRGRGENGRGKAMMRLAETVPPKVRDDAVERAKLALRKCGCIVYDAEITEGSRGRGFIRVDHRRLTRAEVIEAARGRG